MVISAPIFFAIPLRDAYWKHLITKTTHSSQCIKSIIVIVLYVFSDNPGFYNTPPTVLCQMFNCIPKIPIVVKFWIRKPRIICSTMLKVIDIIIDPSNTITQRAHTENKIHHPHIPMTQSFHSSYKESIYFCRLIN